MGKIKIGKWIRGWRLDKFFKRLFNGISDEAKRLLPIVIGVTDEIKAVLDSPVPDVLAALIPGKWDDHLIAKAREWMPIFIIKRDIANVTANIEDPVERANAVLAMLKFSDDETKDDFYHQFSYRLLEFFADGNLSRTELIVLAQMYHDYRHKQAA